MAILRNASYSFDGCIPLFRFNPNDASTVSKTGSRVDLVSDLGSGDFELRNTELDSGLTIAAFPNGAEGLSRGVVGLHLQRTDLAPFTSPRTLFFSYYRDQDLSYLFDSLPDEDMVGDDDDDRIFASDPISRKLYFHYRQESEVELTQSLTGEVVAVAMVFRASPFEFMLRARSNTYGTETSTVINNSDPDPDDVVFPITAITIGGRQNGILLRSNPIGEIIGYAGALGNDEIDLILDRMVDEWM